MKTQTNGLVFWDSFSIDLSKKRSVKAQLLVALVGFFVVLRGTVEMKRAHFVSIWFLQLYGVSFCIYSFSDHILTKF